MGTNAQSQKFWRSRTRSFASARQLATSIGAQKRITMPFFPALALSTSTSPCQETNSGLVGLSPGQAACLSQPLGQHSPSGPGWCWHERPDAESEYTQRDQPL